MKRQMSETMFMGTILAVAGGFLDAYTYICKGHVFANAQTGNIVLFGLNIAEKNWKMAFGYLVPIIAFIFGIFVAEMVKMKYKNEYKIHWRQIVIAIEIVALFIVAFIPQSMNMASNSIISFVCALQVETFRTIRGNACATTMCTGNLRTATELLFMYKKNGDKLLRKKSLEYYFIDIAFIGGAILGTLLAVLFADLTVLFACLILVVAFVAMFIDDDANRTKQVK